MRRAIVIMLTGVTLIVTLVVFLIGQPSEKDGYQKVEEGIHKLESGMKQAEVDELIGLPHSVESGIRSREDFARQTDSQPDDINYVAWWQIGYRHIEIGFDRKSRAVAIVVTDNIRRKLSPHIYPPKVPSLMDRIREFLGL